MKKDAHELILDFIRSRPPLKQVSASTGPPAGMTVLVGPTGAIPTLGMPSPGHGHHLRSHLCIPQASERRLRPLPQKQRTLHEKILEEIRQERKLRPVEQKGTGVPSPLCHAARVPIPTALSPSLRRIQLPALHPARLRRPPELQLLPRAVPVPSQRRACAPAATRPAQGAHPGRDGGDEPLRGKGEPAEVGKHGGCPGALRDTVPMASQEEDSPATEVPLKRDRSFSEQDLAQLQSQLGGEQAAPRDPEPLQPEPRPRSGTTRGLHVPVPRGSVLCLSAVVAPGNMSLPWPPCPSLQVLSPPAATHCQMAQHCPGLPSAPWRRGQRMDPVLPPPAAPSTSGWWVLGTPAGNTGAGDTRRACPWVHGRLA